MGEPHTFKTTAGDPAVLGHLFSQEIYFYFSRARINVQEENSRAQNATRSFLQADLGFLAQVD